MRQKYLVYDSKEHIVSDFKNCSSKEHIISDLKNVSDKPELKPGYNLKSGYFSYSDSYKMNE